MIQLTLDFFSFQTAWRMFSLKSFMGFNLETSSKAFGWFGIFQYWLILVGHLFVLEFLVQNPDNQFVMPQLKYCEIVLIVINGITYAVWALIACIFLIKAVAEVSAWRFLITKFLK
jgi:hypothetical protein